MTVHCQIINICPPKAQCHQHHGRQATAPRGGRRGNMAKKLSKNLGRRARSVEPRPYALSDAVPLLQKAKYRQVRRDRRPDHASRRRPQARRPDGPRHGRSAARPRQDQDRRRHRLGDKQSRSRSRRRRVRRRRRAGREDPEGKLDRLRRPDRHARHDEVRRPSRQGARPQGPDAQPEDRHRHHRRRRRHQRDQGRQGRVPHRQDGAGSRSRRQALLRRRRSWSTTP